METLHRQLEQAELLAEVAKLRSLETVRAEHQRALEREAERVKGWVNELKRSHIAEKTHLLEKIASLEDKVSMGARGHSVTPSVGGSSPVTAVVDSDPATSRIPTPTSGDSAGVLASKGATTPGTLSVSAAPFEPMVPPLTTPSSGDHLLAGSVLPKLSLPSSHVVPSSMAVPTLTTVASLTPPVSVPPDVGWTSPVPAARTSSAESDMATTVGTPGEPVMGGTIAIDGANHVHAGTPTTDMVTTMTRFLQAQAEAMTAQAKGVALQGLPSLPLFTGEGNDAIEDGFDKWIRKFRERAKFAGWSAADQLYQLELHLDKTAIDVFHMLPDSESKDIESAITALGKRFKPGDIAELRGLQFHHRTQGEESIEQLGISIQQLGRKAFPTITGKDFDRLLKGRFYQALQVKWQRKLGAPKPDESFHDLLARARMLEEHEKQFAASAELRSGKSGKKPMQAEEPKPKGSTSSESDSTKKTSEKSGSTNLTKTPEGRCFYC